jgi:hypothetical protein
MAINFLRTLFAPQQSPSMPMNPATAPTMSMPQMQGDFQRMTGAVPDDLRAANIMQAIGQVPQTAPVQMPSQMRQQQALGEPPRKRRSVLDTIGGIADVIARVGGAEALYQPTLDAREDRAKQIDLDAMQKQLLDQQLQVGGQAIQAGEDELASSARARLATALGAVAQNPDAVVMWPQIAAEAGINEQQAAQIGAILESNPKAAGIFAQSLGWSPTVGKGQGSQAKELQVYGLLMEQGGPELAQAYLRNLTNPDSMSEYQKGQLDIALARLGLEREEFDFKRQEAEEGPQETAQERKLRLQKELARPKVEASLRGATNDIDKQIRDLKELRNSRGLDNITGPLAGRLPNITPEATAAQALLDTIIARGGFAALQDMRANSPTGAALGSVSDAEGIRLQNSVASLSQLQATADFQKSIDKYISDLEFSRKNLQQAFEETYPEDEESAPQQTQRRRSSPRIVPRTPAGQRPSAQGGPSREAIEAELRRRGRIQ